VPAFPLHSPAAVPNEVGPVVSEERRQCLCGGCRDVQDFIWEDLGRYISERLYPRHRAEIEEALRQVVVRVPPRMRSSSRHRYCMRSALGFSYGGAGLRDVEDVFDPQLAAELNLIREALRQEERVVENINNSNTTFSIDLTTLFQGRLRHYRRGIPWPNGWTRSVVRLVEHPEPIYYFEGHFENERMVMLRTDDIEPAYLPPMVNFEAIITEGFREQTVDENDRISEKGNDGVINIRGDTNSKRPNGIAIVDSLGNIFDRLDAQTDNYSEGRHSGYMNEESSGTNRSFTSRPIVARQSPIFPY
jgi:hypothetical protein